MLSGSPLFSQPPESARFVSAGPAGAVSVDGEITAEEADAIRLNMHGRGLAKGKIDFAGDEDLFRVVSAMTGEMEVNLDYRGKSPHANPDLYIYDANGDLIAQDTGASFNVTEGETYYIKVAGDQPARGGQYLVKITTEERTDPPPQPDPSLGGTVVGRYVFYNNSVHDGNDPNAGVADDAAIDTSKSALLAGETASFDNYISYVNGINGIMVDIAGLAGTLTAEDFDIRLSGVNDGESQGDYVAGPTPISVTVREGAGVDGSDRVTLIFADTDAYNSQWMQITVKANANTGLGSDDVFYYGLAIGDTGNSSTDAIADDADRLGARENMHDGFLSFASVTDAYDFNRDSIVDASDRLIIRSHETTTTDALKMITAP
jgi:hypothetical protein